ncbi:MAG TPA: undecaprenyl diphosphate synthase family protein, partial [Thermomicrobiales bacterium]|nr:undecaprenyl diphosphate synthase family protein [Thermomicrobiales bacterium]
MSEHRHAAPSIDLGDSGRPIDRARPRRPAAAPATPRHVAMIMDGNGRWAARRGLARIAGHERGTENIRRITQAAAELGIEYLTLWAFSTENWRR